MPRSLATLSLSPAAIPASAFTLFRHRKFDQISMLERQEFLWTEIKILLSCIVSTERRSQQTFDFYENSANTNDSLTTSTIAFRTSISLMHKPNLLWLVVKRMI